LSFEASWNLQLPLAAMTAFPCWNASFWAQGQKGTRHTRIFCGEKQAFPKVWSRNPSN